MTPSGPPLVSVIVAAHDAAGTLTRAIRSALAEPETLEVLVIDDASRDATRSVVRAEAEQDARVRLIAFDENRGPAAARNRGLDEAAGAYAAILDSDDFFLPGRLAMLLSAAPADLIADNIVFANPDAAGRVERRAAPADALFETLDTAGFVRGNLQRRGEARGELGFLKPLLSTAFLRTHGLRYDPALRLAEDYDLYVRMLMAGARMKLTAAPGYGAVVRAGSLSARHRTEDLARLHNAIELHLATPELPEDVRRATRSHLLEVRRKRDHRRFLDLRHEAGALAALRYALAAPDRAGPIAAGIARDKLGLSAAAGAALGADGTRLLLPERDGSEGRRILEHHARG